MDLYGILGIEKNISKEDIKKAYRKLAMKYHPDRNKGDKESEAKFKEINEAYSVLSDDSKRQQYDTFGTTSGAGNPFETGGVDVDLSDIFESFFGGGSRGSQRNTSYKGEDLEYLIDIDLKTSIYGGENKINFSKFESCDTCNGAGGKGKTSCNKCNGKGKVTFTSQSIFGTIQQTGTCDKCSGSGEKFNNICNTCNGNKRKKVTKEISINIPAGIDDGMIIKLTGEGNDGVGTKACGDLYVKFSVYLEEKGLKRDGTNLYYEIEIDIIEAVLGTKKEILIPILGKKIIDITAGTPNSTIIKINSCGVKYINSESKGDLYITINIKIPKKLGKKERELYEAIANEKKINVNKGGVFKKIFG